MSETLRSVGLDVGTTTTQLIVSRLTVVNRAGSFAVPEMEIAERTILYKSPVHFTPLKDESHVDGNALRQIVTEEYKNAGITRESVDTGAIIITGETSRKENARTVLESLADLAGDFVVATAGPDLESRLAAKGAGAVEFSAKTGKRVLHMDIGGGTSNLALIEDGRIVQTGCLNVGGRLLKFEKDGKICYVSPVLKELCKLKAGQTATMPQVREVAGLLVSALEMAAGLRERTQLLDALWTKEERNSSVSFPQGEPLVISFSGGVADCIEAEQDWLEFGDMGPVLGKAIRESSLCRGEYRLGGETIRATVIGAGCHSAQLSGSTVFYRNFPLPVKNMPVVCISRQEQDSGELPRIIEERLRSAEAEPAVIAMPGYEAPEYSQVTALAERLAKGIGGRSAVVCLEADMAKALGHALVLRLPRDARILCIDRVRLEEGSYLDVGAPVGPALPVVIKTLILAR